MANKTVSAVVKLVDQFTNPSKEVARSASNIEKRFKNVASGFKNVGAVFDNVGTAMTKKITLPLVGVGVATGKMAMDFENAIAKVNTIADSSEVPMKDMEKAIMNLSDQTGISSSEIANNVYDAISAGQKTGDAVNFVEKSAKLAKAGFADSAQAMDILTTTMNAYGLKAEEVTKVSDVLIKTQNLGKTTVAELSSSMGKIIPTAKSNGVALEQVAAGYAVMTAKGIATAETTTYMNSMFNELGKSGTKASEALKEKTGKSFSELMQSGSSLSEVIAILSDEAKANGKSLGDMFGSAEAGKAALTLLGDSAESFNGVLGEMNNATGSTDAAFEKLQTSSVTIEKTINKLKNTGIKLGSVIVEMVSPAINEASEYVDKFCGWFDKLDEAQKKNLVKFAGMAAAAGPVLMGFGKLNKGIGGVIENFGGLSNAGVKVFADVGKFAKTFHGATVGEMGAAFGKIGGLVSKAVGRSTLLTNVFGGVGKMFGKVGGIFGSVGGKITGVFGKVISKCAPLQTAFGKVGGLIGKLYGHTGFGGLAKIMGGSTTGALFAVAAVGLLIYKNWDKIQPIIKKVADRFREFSDKIKPDLDNVTGALKPVVSFLKDVFMGAFKVAFDAAGAWVVQFFESTSKIIGDVLDVFSGVIKFLSGVFTGNWKKAWEGLKEIVAGVFRGIVDVVKTPLNAVIAVVNGAFSRLNKISYDVPEWVPKFGGKHIGFHLPQIPQLAKGTDDWRGGVAQVHERGGEIIDLPKGTRVYPHDESVQMAKADGNKTITVNIPKFADQIIVRTEQDIQKLADAIARELADKLERVQYNMA